MTSSTLRYGMGQIPNICPEDQGKHVSTGEKVACYHLHLICVHIFTYMCIESVMLVLTSSRNSRSHVMNYS